LFLTDSSDFWRNQEPIYVTNDEKEKNAISKNKKVRKSASAKKRIKTAVKQPTRAESAPVRAKQVLRSKSASSKAKPK
jgi:hypothetical protein